MYTTVKQGKIYKIRSRNLISKFSECFWDNVTAIQELQWEISDVFLEEYVIKHFPRIGFSIVNCWKDCKIEVTLDTEMMGIGKIDRTEYAKWLKQ